MVWTPDRDAELQTLLAAGLSYSQIALRMYTSRKAVAGRIYRLKLRRAPPSSRAKVCTWRTKPVHRAIAVVAAHYGISTRGLVNDDCRYAPQVRRRQLVMWLARRLGASFEHAGYYLGFDHSTVVHGCRRIEAMRVEDAAFRQLCDELQTAAEEFPANIPRKRVDRIASSDSPRRRWADDLSRSFGL